MKHLLLLVVCWLASAEAVFPQKVELAFEVFMGDDRIGSLQAVEELKGKSSRIEIRTKTEASLWSLTVQIETGMSVTKENGILIQSAAYRRSNVTTEDMHASSKRLRAGSYEHEANGDVRTVDSGDITLCVADLYFREPKGATTIFSNMHGEYVPLKLISTGKYHLVTPDNKDSFYTYHNGQLTLIESDTPLGRIVSKKN